jgi:hypothetical protein
MVHGLEQSSKPLNRKGRVKEMARTAVYFRLSSVFFAISLTEIVLILIYHLWMEYRDANESLPQGYFTLAHGGGILEIGVTIHGKYYSPSQIGEAISFVFKPDDIVFEVSKTGIFQLTGNIKWRFLEWGIIGGSKAATDISLDLDPLFRMALPPNRSEAGPPKASAVFFPSSPLVLTLLLLLISLVLRIIGHRSNADEIINA